MQQIVEVSETEGRRPSGVVKDIKTEGRGPLAVIRLASRGMRYSNTEGRGPLAVTPQRSVTQWYVLTERTPDSKSSISAAVYAPAVRSAN